MTISKYVFIGILVFLCLVSAIVTTLVFIRSEQARAKAKKTGDWAYAKVVNQISMLLAIASAFLVTSCIAIISLLAKI